MQNLTSIKNVEKRYNTGEEPILVSCDDQHSYICKYSRYSGSANKLVCELLGSIFAKTWRINTPDVAYVKVLSQHVPHNMSTTYFSIPVLGSRLQTNVVDITPTSIPLVPSTEKLCEQLMRIALFDLWLANEDRNANNANLMYDIVQQDLIAIDFGCCFNTATFDFPLSQLTETDNILCSDLFTHIIRDISKERVLQMAEVLLTIDYMSFIHDCQSDILIADWDEDTNSELRVNYIPKQWNVNRERLKNKLQELLNEEWTEQVRENFRETLNSVLNHE